MFWKTFFCGDRLKNFCENLFFFLESTCACVLGSWPCPRAFLSLASRVSVLGKAVLGLGLGFFLCPWPPQTVSITRKQSWKTITAFTLTSNHMYSPVNTLKKIWMKGYG